MYDQICIIYANPLIFFRLSRITAYYLSKGRQFIVQDLSKATASTHSL